MLIGNIFKVAKCNLKLFNINNLYHSGTFWLQSKTLLVIWSSIVELWPCLYTIVIFLLYIDNSSQIRSFCCWYIPTPDTFTCLLTILTDGLGHRKELLKSCQLSVPKICFKWVRLFILIKWTLLLETVLFLNAVFVVTPF